MAEDEQKDKHEFHFDRKNYFLRFNRTNIESTNKSISKSVRHALEYFVDDLRRNRTKTIERFISESTTDEMFRSIAQFLLSNDDRICGDCAFILGSLIELERGLELFLLAFSSTNPIDIIRYLSQLLTHRDVECVLNAAGTLGTICGSKEGRDLLVNHVCISQVVINTSMLLSSTNNWIASNAALVLARITVEDLGCRTILSHPKHREILNSLFSALDINDSSRSTNIAFAIARLIEGEEGKRLVIDDCGREKFFQALLIMLEINDGKDMHKNACYTLSSFCTSEFGFELCIQSLTIFNRILIAIERILLSKEHETVWFALMCLRTIAKYEGSNEYLCSSGHLLDVIRQVQQKWTDSKQIQEESKILWFMIHRGIKPGRPNIDDCRDTSADISWLPCSYQRNDAPVQYRILLDESSVGVTQDTHFTLTDLKLNTSYRVRIQFITTEGESAISDPTFFHTDDQIPPSITNLHVARATMNALRVVWELLDTNSGNNVKGYQVYLNNSEFEVTNECGITISSLLSNTDYQIDVCTILSKGHGPRSSIRAKTSNAGDSVPPPPIFTVVGRRELHIKWQAPEVIAGRLTRYDLFCNDRCIYSGTDQEYHASMLKPDTEYTIEVVAITNEGRFRSRPAKTRTLKDEFHPNRHALYESTRNKRMETIQTKPKVSTSEKSPAKEIKSVPPSFLPNQNIQITTVRAVHFKTDSSSPRAGLPGVYKATAVRPIRTHHRFRTETKSFTQPRISASVIIPTLDIDHPRDLAWPNRIKAFRYPL